MFSDNFVFYKSWIIYHGFFYQYVAHYSADKCIKTSNFSEQYRCSDYSQLAYRSSLQDTEICL